MIDSAVLSLVRALEAASPRDVDAYLAERRPVIPEPPTDWE